jgi:hypothetical protein
MSKNKTVSIGTLLAMHSAMADERRNWHVKESDQKAFAVRAGRNEFTKHPFPDYDAAMSFIHMKCLAAGLETLGLKVEALD